MKKIFLLLISVLFITGCTSQTDIDTDKSIKEQPLSSWVKLDNDTKNTLMIEAFNEAGLEKKDWRNHLRMTINDLTKAAVQPETRDLPIQQALDIQVKNVHKMINN